MGEKQGVMIGVSRAHHALVLASIIATAQCFSWYFRSGNNSSKRRSPRHSQRLAPGISTSAALCLSLRTPVLPTRNPTPPQTPSRPRGPLPTKDLTQALYLPSLKPGKGLGGMPLEYHVQRWSLPVALTARVEVTR